MKSNSSSQSNSKSEDTPYRKLCKGCNKIWLHGIKGEYCSSYRCQQLDKSEPPQDTSLDKALNLIGEHDGHKEYCLEGEIPYCEQSLNSAKNAIKAWHKAERAKLFDQIRSEVIGDDEYPDEHFPVYLGHKDDALAKKFDEVVTRDRLKTKQREALNRLELSNNLKEDI